MALSGGLRYSPTTSVSLSVKCLSFDSLKRFVRWGWSPWDDQMRWTVALLPPRAWHSGGPTALRLPAEQSWPSHSRSEWYSGREPMLQGSSAGRRILQED